MKKVIALIATLVIIVSLAGCGGQPAQKPAEPAKPAPAPAPQPAQPKDDVIKIGYTGPLSGDAAAWGQQEKMGITLAEEEINAKGGVLGKKIQVVQYDDRGDKVEVVNVVRRLINQDNVVAIVGENMSSMSLAMAPVVEEAKVAAISTMAIHPSVTQPAPDQVRKYFFRVSFTSPVEGGGVAWAAGEKLKAKKVAVIYDVSQDYSKTLLGVFKEKFPKWGGQIVAEETIKGGEEDFKAILTRVKAKNPDLIALTIYYKEAALIIKQARDLGIKAPFVGGGGLDSDDFVKIGGKATEGTYIVTHWSPEDPSPKNQEFRKAFKAKWNVEPDCNAAAAYDALYIIVDSIKRAGKADREAVRDQIEATRDFPAVTGAITFDPKTHNPKLHPVLLQVKDGKFAFIEATKE
ncbi:MAG: ABC transporter substrate-binding protein [Firmicutes bacterium]|nr:ABC transporter substrate-binding protein [Bacillota bacterium]